jgi:hypothetical protein
MLAENSYINELVGLYEERWDMVNCRVCIFAFKGKESVALGCFTCGSSAFKRRILLVIMTQNGRSFIA